MTALGFYEKDCSKLVRWTCRHGERDAAKRMIYNILWLVDHLGFDGSMHGAGKYYLSTIPFFDRAQFSIHLCVVRHRDRLTRDFEKNSIPITHLGRDKFDPLALVDVVRLCKKRNIHLIHAHGYGASDFARLAGKMIKVPVMLHAHDDDPNYPSYQMIADRLLKNWADKAVAVSASVKHACVQKRGMSERRVSVLHNGIQLNRFTPAATDRAQLERNRWQIPRHCKVVGTVTRLRDEKGVRYLVQAAPKVLETVPEAFFVIAGDGPRLEELRALSVELKVEQKVIFAGFCHDVPSLLSVFEVFSIPSLTEGSPSALLEAMAMAKPIVATNVGGMKEILKDGQTALLVPSQDSEALADKIIYLLRNVEIATRLGRSAHEESKKYDITLHVKKLESFYRELIASK